MTDETKLYSVWQSINGDTAGLYATFLTEEAARASVASHRGAQETSRKTAQYFLDVRTVSELEPLEKPEPVATPTEAPLTSVVPEDFHVEEKHKRKGMFR